MSWYKFAFAKYWGKKASGCLFICKDDKTILLFLRSKDVEQSGTWGITGGAVQNEIKENENFFESDIEEYKNPENEIFEDSAIRETIEEAGTFPSETQLITTVDFVDNSFTYRTIIYNLSLKEKESWTPTITLNWESNEYKWFPIDNLPGNLHFGIKQKLDIIIEIFANKNQL